MILISSAWEGYGRTVPLKRGLDSKVHNSEKSEH